MGLNDIGLPVFWQTAMGTATLSSAMAPRFYHSS
jgi:hypothetical protein